MSILRTAMSRPKPFRKDFSGKPIHSAPVSGAQGGSFWIYGHHAVTAALSNPKRQFRRLVATGMAIAEFLAPLSLPKAPILERIEGAPMNHRLPAGSVHQGRAALVELLPLIDLSELLEDIPEGVA